MKKIFTCSIVVFLALTACKNGGDKKLSVDEALKKAGSAPGANAGSGKFDITAPSGWRRTDTSVSGLKATLLMGPDTSGYRVNVSVITEAMQGTSIDRYVDMNVANLAKYIPQYGFVAKGQKEIAGLPARWIHYTQVSGGVPLDEICYIIPNNGIAYLVTCTTLKGQMEKEQAIFDQILSTFNVL